MFEKYTEKARRTIFFARYEASQYGSPYIEVAHLLLGLARESPATFLEVGADREAVGRVIGPLCARSSERISTSVDLPLSHPCKRVLTYAAEESEGMGHRHIGPEHLLLGVLRQNGPEARALAGLGIGLEGVRKAFREGPEEPKDALQSLERLLLQVPVERLAAAAQILAGLSSEYFTVTGASADGPFAFTFGEEPPAANSGAE